MENNNGQTRQRKSNIILTILRMGNPVFIIAAVAVPVGALIYAMNFGPLTFINYVHIMTGAMWTGIDLFMGLVLGPALGGMTAETRAAAFRRLIPKMTFLMPSLAAVAVTSGIELVGRLGYPWTNPWIIASAVIAGLLTIQGLGLLLPNEIRVFAQLLSDKPDIDKISRLGMLNMRLGGVQGIFQLAIIFIMANLRF